MSSVIVIRGWERFQHYRDRDPPWVKLYRDMLTTESWVMGTDISRLVQVACILLAARYQNATPLNFALIRKVASLDCKEREFNDALKHLAKTDWLEIQQVADERKQPASSVLAKCSSETETETETEAETEAEKTRVRARDPAPECEGLDPQAFARWTAYRAQIRKPLKPASLPAAQRALAAFGADQAAVVEQSIAHGWQGLFALKTLTHAKPAQTWVPPDDEPQERRRHAQA